MEAGTSRRNHNTLPQVAVRPAHRRNQCRLASRANILQRFRGRWDAAFTLNQTVIPFCLDIAGDGFSLAAVLYNCDLKQTTTSAKLEDGEATLNFEHCLTRIVVSTMASSPARSTTA